MLRKVSLLIFFLTALSAPAQADWFSGSADLQKLLSSPEVTVGDYELSKDELLTFYTARNFRAAWDFNGSSNSETFSAFLTSISQLIDYHGLQREDYALELMQKLVSLPDNDSKASLELLVTDTLIKLSHDLHGDSIDLTDLYPGWNFKRSPLDVPTSLNAAISGGSLNEYIESITPKNPAYRQLAEDLRIYRGIASKGGWKKIEPGSPLKPGDHGVRITELRERLAAEGYSEAASQDESASSFYDETLKKAVMRYQSQNGLASDGSIGPRALDALNTPLSVRLDQIMANMERWRHMPEDFPPGRYALVNIPDQSIVFFEDGKAIYHGLVIVGRVDRKTPFIQSTIRSMIFNPIWHVPSKIARKDILPKLKSDPHYLEKLGFVISGSADDPHGANIDWKSITEREFDFRLRQSPGDLNSLGRLKFDFDNDFAVYMHGTPHQELFKKNERALSSGCVRLHDPEKVAEILLASNKGGPWDIPHIEDTINSNKTHWVGFPNPLPLYIVYWSVFQDANDQINFRNDIYDYDSFLMQNMRSDDGQEGSQKGTLSQ